MEKEKEKTPREIAIEICERRKFLKNNQDAAPEYARKEWQKKIDELRNDLKNRR